MFQTAEVTLFRYSNKGFIENKGCSVKGVNVTVIVHGLVCLVYMNCGNHVGGAVGER